MIYKDGWLAYDPVIDSHSGLPQDVDRARPRADRQRRLAGARRSPTRCRSCSRSTRGTGWLLRGADLTPAYDGKAAVRRSSARSSTSSPTPSSSTTASRAQPARSRRGSSRTPAQPTISGDDRDDHERRPHAARPARCAPAGATASVYDYTTRQRLLRRLPPRRDDAGRRSALPARRCRSTARSTLGHARPDATRRDLALAGGTHRDTSRSTTTRSAATLTIGGATTTLGAGVDALPE